MLTQPFIVRFASLFAASLLLIAGCSNQPKICRVSGTVKLAGKPVSNIEVHFVPAEGRQSHGLTDANGAFKLIYSREKEGAQKGIHKVYFSFRPRNPQEEMEYEAGNLKLSPEVQSVLERFGHLETTTLSFEVTTDGQVIDIALD